MKDSEIENRRIALVAGNGQFPIEFAKKVSHLGKEVIVIAFEGETDPAIAEYTSTAVSWIRVGQLGRLLSIVKKSRVKELAFAGGISRVRLFRNFFPDFKALALAARVGSIRDDMLLRALAAEIEKLGVSVISAATYLDNAVPVAGNISKRHLSNDEISDALIGWRVAKLSGELDVGQSVLVYKSLVIAVEAVEGTDQAIKRAGELSGLAGAGRKESGLVLVKVCKPQQDRRLDLPSIGPRTIEEMHSAGVTALVVEAGASLFIDPVRITDLARQYGIAIFAAAQEADLSIPDGAKRNFSFS